MNSVRMVRFAEMESLSLAAIMSVATCPNGCRLSSELRMRIVLASPSVAAAMPGTATTMSIETAHAPACARANAVQLPINVPDYWASCYFNGAGQAGGG